MNQELTVILENKIHDCNAIKQPWERLKTVISEGKVASRNEAYLTFSRALKISNELGQDSEVKKLWKVFLTNGCFSLQGTDYKYDFKAVLSLFKEGKTEFDIKWMPFNCESESDHLVKIAERINAIALDSVGSCPGDALTSILRNPTTFGMVAHYYETPIACIYGTFVESLQLFHFNFLGRRINYPGVHIVKQLKSQMNTLQNKLPHLRCVTLCVQKDNIHAQSIYQSLGFKQLDYIEAGFGGNSMYFYGKNLDSTDLPTYGAFKKAYDEIRRPHLTG